jgi:hypothetical protein
MAFADLTPEQQIQAVQAGLANGMTMEQIINS